MGLTKKIGCLVVIMTFMVCLCACSEDKSTDKGDSEAAVVQEQMVEDFEKSIDETNEGSDEVSAESKSDDSTQQEREEAYYDLLEEINEN